MDDLKKLQELAKGFAVLYVEDNDSLRANATKLLKKFFSVVYVGADGKEGLELFKEHRPELVVTDIKMPKLDGMVMAKKIRHVSPDTKIIIMSAFDEKDYLYQAIEIGLFRFIKKPVNISELSTVLYQAIIQIKHEKRARLFQAQLGSIFNYQGSMITMLKHNKPIIANQPMLDFYDVEDIDELNEKYPDIGSNFLEHEGFLYSDNSGNWMNEVLANKNKIFNVKMQDKSNKIRHFILKCQEIPDKNNYGILSFDDVTELNLLSLFKKQNSDDDLLVNDAKAMGDLLHVLQRNSAKVSLHNYYKGISITNDAVIMDIKENSLSLKTSYVQQKAVQYEGKSLITSDALPHAIECSEVESISFEKQTIEFKKIKFVATSPVTRETIRLVPEEGHQVTMFVDESKYMGELSIVDISLNSVKLSMSALPAGFEIGNIVRLDMVFMIDKKPTIINTQAKIFKKKEKKRSFEVVFLFELESKIRAILVKYITKRQMAIIREFKGVQNG